MLLVVAFGWTRVDTGELLGDDEFTVRTHLRRGLTNLCKALEVTTDAADLDDQLAIYGRWIEQQCATELRAPQPTAIARASDPVAGRRDVDIDNATPAPQPHRPVRLAVDACVIVVVGVGGLVVANRQTCRRLR